MLEVEARPVAPDHRDAFDLLQVPQPVTVLHDHDGNECVVIGDGPSAVRLEVTSGSLLRGPVRLRYYISGFEGVEAKVMTLRRLLALWRLGRLPLSLCPPERRARRWALALQAYDGMRAGASQREIAVVLFGAARVDADWGKPSESLRLQVQRLIRTAEKLIQSGYRHLLRS